MESKDELKEIDFKNRTCFYFDDIMSVRDKDFIRRKQYKNILIYYIMASKPLRVRFDEIDWFIKIYDAIRYLILFGSGWYDEMYDKIEYLISEKK